MNRTGLCLTSWLLAALIQTQQPSAGQQRPAAGKEAAAPKALEPLQRYDNRQFTLMRAGKATAAHVTIRDWEIHGRQKIPKFPETGALIVHLQSGRVITTIQGKQEKREPGDYWSIPAEGSMGVEVTSESAILHIVAIGKS
jgi:quercetin dioxygenase-like cupin family protein